MSRFTGQGDEESDRSHPFATKLLPANLQIPELEAVAAGWQTVAYLQQQIAQEGGMTRAANVFGLGGCEVCLFDVIGGWH